ncbi:hypothetical protein HDV00_010700 [Rhizophlyctis rosea]|nr:hypothetical protein HDV00_010700 [Rhizophlyctis rosea]
MKFTALATAALFAASSVDAALYTAAPLKDLAAKHGIYAGVAVGNGNLGDANFTAILKREFNYFTPENSMKWEVTEPNPAEFHFADGDVIVAAAKAQNAKVRGHTLVWHSQLASWVNAKTNWTKPELTAVIERHIKGVAGYYNDLAHWDVVNEVMGDDCKPRDSVFLRTFGNIEDYVDLAFRTAKKYASPKTKLYINDYNMEGEAICKSDAIHALIKKLKARGTPIDGLGAQAHFVVGGIPANITAVLQKFANLGVDVALTEIDIRAQQINGTFTPAMYEQQGKDYEQVIRACLAVKRCVGFTLWGITDRYSWIPGVWSDQGIALPWDLDYNTKPAYEGIVRALTTKETKTTTTKTTTTTTGYTKPTKRAVRA